MLKIRAILFKEVNIILIGPKNDLFIIGTIIEMIVFSEFEIHYPPRL
jgi:hypothetical protein